MHSKQLLVTSVVLVCFGTASVAASVVTGNLLQNPSGESGVLTPWTQYPGSLVSGPAELLPIGTVGPTDGSFWFRRDTSYARTTEGGSSYGNRVLSQMVNISSFGNIQSIEFGGDFFGVGQVLSGNATITNQDSVSLTFFASDGTTQLGSFTV